MMQMPGGDPNQMIQMLMDLLTKSPDAPAGDVPRSMPPSVVPADVLNGDPLAAIMPLLQQILGGQGMMQGGQQMQNGPMGVQGGAFGGMGGRPTGGSVPPSALR